MKILKSRRSMFLFLGISMFTFGVKATIPVFTSGSINSSSAGVLHFDGSNGVNDVYSYTYTLPYYETALTALSAINFKFTTNVSYPAGYTKYMQVSKNNGSIPQTGVNGGVIDASKSYFTFNAGSTFNVGNYDIYRVVTYGRNTMSQVVSVVTTDFMIKVINEPAPVISNFLLANSCTEAVNHTTVPPSTMYNGVSVSVYSCNYSNASNVYVKYTTPQGISSDFKLSTLATGSPTGTIVFNSNTLLNNASTWGTHKGELYHIYTPYLSSTPVRHLMNYPAAIKVVSQKMLANCLPQIMVGPKTGMAVNPTVVYPNTIKENVNVKTDGQKLKTITVYDLRNNVVSKNTFADGNEEENVDLSNLQKGMYIIEIETETSKERKQIIKE